MDNPINEIQNVIHNIFVSLDKSLLEKEVKRSFAPDFEFIHFLAYVPSGPESREKIIWLYKSFRGIYRSDDLRINEISYNEENGKMFLDVTHHLKLLLFPWRITPLRLVVIFNFKRNDEGKYVISRHEDLLDPGELIKVFVPYLAPIVNVAKGVATYSAILAGRVFELTGWV